MARAERHGIVGNLSAAKWRVGLAAAVFAAGAGALAPAPADAAVIDVVDLTAEQIQADYAAGKYTAVELTQAFLDRIGQYEPTYNAWITLNPKVLEEAAAIDELLKLPGPKSPFLGVPIAIKDAMDVKGMPTTGGSAALSSRTGGFDLIPDKDAPIVARLRDAGALILGKTNIPDWSRDGSRSTSTVEGATHNAYAWDRAPGGSSGGTAVAVATSMAVAGTAEETGSSITNPASANSIVGIRPTFGLVPSTGVMPGAGTFRDVMGPHAKTVRDAAVMLDIIAGPTKDDLQMVHYLGETGLPALFVLTKADKLTRTQRTGKIRKAVELLNVPEEQVLPFSSLTGEGREDLLESVEALLQQG